MLRMDLVYVIRHKLFVENKSLRQVSRELKLSRTTVKKYSSLSQPARVEKSPRPTPVKDKVCPRIDELLQLWRGRTTSKQRITGSRLHRQLLDEGFQVGITTVRACLREKRRQSAEVFIPLVYRPAESAQVDFFEVTVERAGALCKAWKFLMRLMYSGYDFVWLYERCDQLSFLDAHVRAFSYFGGVPHRLTYDNLTAAVRRIIGGDRQLTDRFAALSSHYLFEPCFARPGEGHDKGGVESRGKNIRLQHLVPIPRGESLQAISQAILSDLGQAYRTKLDAEGRSVVERFQQERDLLRDLPGQPFEARRIVMVCVSSKATLQIEGATYSVPSTWARLQATAHVGVEDIRITCHGQEVIYPKAKAGTRSVRYRDYLPQLARKPQAVRQVAPQLIQELGQPFEKLWDMLVQTYGGKEGGRVLARILGVIVEHGQEAVSEAIKKALEDGRIDLLALGERLHSSSDRERVEVPEALSRYEVESSSASDYDWLLGGGER